MSKHMNTMSLLVAATTLSGCLLAEETTGTLAAPSLTWNPTAFTTSGDGCNDVTVVPLAGNEVLVSFPELEANPAPSPVQAADSITCSVFVPVTIAGPVKLVALTEKVTWGASKTESSTAHLEQRGNLFDTNTEGFAVDYATGTSVNVGAEVATKSNPIEGPYKSKNAFCNDPTGTFEGDYELTVSADAEHLGDPNFAAARITTVLVNLEILSEWDGPCEPTGPGGPHDPGPCDHDDDDRHDHDDDDRHDRDDDDDN